MPMNRASPSPAGKILEAACAEALAAARWDEADLATRWPGDEARALLLAKAAECALSAFARDQLLSVAIERVVGHADRETPLLDGTTDPGERAEIARQTFALGPHKASETDALVALVESRHAPRLGGGTASDRVAACFLREDAVLHELLWDHPDLPADPHTRLAMLCAIPRLRDRADQLTLKSGRFAGLKRLLRWARPGRPE